MGCGSSTSNTVGTHARIPKETLDRIHKRFYDHSPTGKMTQPQFVSMHFQLHNISSNQELVTFLVRLYKALDKESVGVLTYKRYIEMWDILINGIRADRLEVGYHLCDADRNGQLTQDEFYDGVSSIAAFRQDVRETDVIRTMVADEFSDWDVDNKGYVTVEDLRKAGQEALQQYKFLELLCSSMERALTGSPPAPEK